MPPTYCYGRQANLAGKTLFEIMASMRNLSANRKLIKQDRLLMLNSGRRCLYTVGRIQPILNTSLKYDHGPSKVLTAASFDLVGGIEQDFERINLMTNFQGCANRSSKLHFRQIDQLNSLLLFSDSSSDTSRHSPQQVIEQKPATSPSPQENNAPQKRTLYKKIVDELKHYYHGFRLLFIDLRISSRYVRKLLKGEQLSRREHQQLVRSTSDLFRLVPFSVFIIVPFMEFLLPVFIKLFPSMLPSTFMTSKDKDAKIKSQLKVKIDMAKFLQQTLDEMAFQVKGESHSEEAKKFAKFFEEVRASGTGASNVDILKYSKLFEDEITLDSMTRQQLVACCKLLELKPLGTNAFLRFQLRMRLKALRADDEMIRTESIKSLTVSELQAACRARGMRALGVPIERLQAQLSEWLELSLDAKIPPSLLLLSRALFVPENIPTSEQLKVTIQSLPDLAATEVKKNIGEIEGKVDNKTKLEFLKQEEMEIQKEELQESVESFQSNYDEALIDKAEEVIDRAVKMNQTIILKVVKEKSERNDLTMEFLESVESDLDKLLSDKEELLSGVELPEEEYDLRELKEEMEDYREEKGEKELQRISESKAARRLSKRVDKMIGKLDEVLDKIENKEKAFQEFKKRQEMLAKKYSNQVEGSEDEKSGRKSN